MALKTLENVPVMAPYSLLCVASTDDPCGVVPSYSVPTKWASLGARTRRGEPVPNWMNRIRTKVSASSVYSRTFIEVKKSQLGHFENVYGAASCTATGWSPREFRYSQFGMSPTLWSTALVKSTVPSDPTTLDIAVRKLRSKMNDHEQLYNAVIPIVELREFHGLVRGIQQSATGLIKAQHNLLDTVHSVKKLRQVLAHAGGAWLSWSFGLKPMLNDAEAAAKAVAQATVEQAMYRIHTSHYKEWVERYQPSFWKGQALGKVKVDYYSQAKYLLRYSYACGINPLVSCANDYAALAGHLGLSWRSVVPAAWELLPYSWMYDYFSTIGDALEDTFQVTRYPVYGTLATTFTQTITNSCSPPGGGKWVDYVYSKPCVCSQVPMTVQEHRYYNRSLIQTVPERAFRFKTVDEIASHAGSKLLNLISLLASRNASYVKRLGFRR